MQARASWAHTYLAKLDYMDVCYVKEVRSMDDDIRYVNRCLTDTSKARNIDRLNRRA